MHIGLSIQSLILQTYGKLLTAGWWESIIIRIGPLNRSFAGICMNRMEGGTVGTSIHSIVQLQRLCCFKRTIQLIQSDIITVH